MSMPLQSHAAKVTRQEYFVKLARELGAAFLLEGGPDVVDDVVETIGGGAHVVIERWTIVTCSLAMNSTAPCRGRQKPT